MKTNIIKLLYKQLGSLSDFNFRITSAITAIAVFSVSVLIFIFITFVYLSQTNTHKNIIENIDNTNKISQAFISEKLSIIISNQEFIDYIRSGDLSREMDYYKIAKLFLSMEPELIHSLNVIKNNNVIFSYGKKQKTDQYIQLNLCYLDDSLNFKLGQCKYKLDLYINREKYINRLSKINPNIEECYSTKCIEYNIFNPHKFGSFPVVDSSFGIIKLQYKQPKWYLMYVLMFCILVVVASVFIGAIFVIRHLVQNYLQHPLDLLKKSMRENSMSNAKNLKLIEFVQLSELIRENKEKQLQIQIGKVGVQLAHDVKSPLNAIDVLLNKKDINLDFDEKGVLSNAIKRINNISDGLLKEYKNSISDTINTSVENTIFSLSSSIREILSEKIAEYKLSHIDFNLLELQENKSADVLGDSTEFKRVLSNLLNNSVKALSLKKSKLIDIKISEINGYYRIQIKDNGVGIDSHLLRDVKQGKTKGLGIKHAINCINSMSGRLNITSKVSNWTVVTIDIPKAQIKEKAFCDNLFFDRHNTINQIKVDLVFIDDQETNTDTWKLAARLKNLKIITYNDYKKFLCDIETIPNDTPIYVDYDLNCQNYNGLSFTKRLHDIGFINLHISTSYMLEDNNYPWLRSVISKKPPFLNTI
ncbi:sensor histidine kinase [Cysteiniphilum litorale]|uniref:sensor histidine kinase n=1 Tax=Cysteiniphilum litorale TaxID=2056700 RepID=UPI003F881EF6